MKPIPFKESNLKLGAPAGMESQVAPLPAHSDGQQVISCWSLSWRERLRVLLFGTIWMSVLSGGTQPPVALTTDRPFRRASRREVNASLESSERSISRHDLDRICSAAMKRKRKGVEI